MDKQPEFELTAGYRPAGDQPEAIAKLIDGLTNGLSHQTLLGVTGSGKTFTIANVIEAVQRPTLVLAHNKTLAAQLYGNSASSFRAVRSNTLFPTMTTTSRKRTYPHRIPTSRRTLRINEHIEQMRLSATKALLERPDSIIVATVSAIYGLGDPQAYLSMVLHLVRGEPLDQRKLLRRLADMQYTRNELDLLAGHLPSAWRCHRHLPGGGRAGSGSRGTVRRQGRVPELFRPADGRSVAQGAATYGVSDRHTTSRPRNESRVRSTRSVTSCVAGYWSCAPPASSSRHSAWSSARASTWR